MLIPSFLRKENMTALLEIISTAFNHCFNSLLSKRNTDIFRLTHDGQVCSLRAALAIFLGVDFEQITITDNSDDNQVVFYDTVEETGRVITNNANMLLSAEVGSFENFIVNIPVSFLTKTDEIKAMIEIYKLVGKTYKIQYYESN
jgi:hypothetical protein